MLQPPPGAARTPTPDTHPPAPDTSKKPSRATKPRRPRRSKAGTVFAYRNRWRAQVRLPNGQRKTKDFDTKDKADKWLVSVLATAGEAVHLPELGGPSQCKLAEAMWHYAYLVTINKKGAPHELTRINHYLKPAGLPILKLKIDGDGRRHLEQVDWRHSAALPTSFERHRMNRLAIRDRTYKAIAELSEKRVSTITEAMLESLQAKMRSEGLTESTIQKEFALLKALFNKAIETWSWTGFVNPAAKIKLGKSVARFVVFTSKDRENLDSALARCDNPLVPLLVEAAIWTMARRDSLLRLHRNDVDLDARTAILRDSKVGDVVVPLSQRAVDVLRRVPHHSSGRFFPMTASAVDNAWDGARVRAKRPDLQFRDLRHIGGTTYARWGLSAHALRLMLGHKTLAQALVYINMVANDVRELLDRTEPDASALPALPAAVLGSAQDEMKRRRAKRLNRTGQPPANGAEHGAPDDGCGSLPENSANVGRATSNSVPPVRAVVARYSFSCGPQHGWKLAFGD